jgi:hypothetical protein
MEGSERGSHVGLSSICHLIRTWVFFNVGFSFFFGIEDFKAIV